jgi:hypothetical protein
MDAKSLAAIINTAINELLKMGASPTTIKRLRSELEQVLDESAIQPENAVEHLRRYHQEFLNAVIKCKGIPVRAIVSDGEKTTSNIKGMGMEGKFDLLEPKIHDIFDACIKDAEFQAPLFRQQELLSALNTFEEWAQSIPLGGTKDKLFRDEARDVRKQLKSVQKWNEYYFIEKSGCFSNRINHLISESNNTIAAIWNYRSFNIYDEKCEHNNYDGKVYLIRDNWAIKRGFIIIDSSTKYTDELPIPNDDYYCNCHYQYLYRLHSLPIEILTPKGKTELIDLRKKLAAYIESNEAVKTLKNNETSFLKRCMQSIRKLF